MGDAFTGIVAGTSAAFAPNAVHNDAPANSRAAVSRSDSKRGVANATAPCRATIRFFDFRSIITPTDTPAALDAEVCTHRLSSASQCKRIRMTAEGSTHVTSVRRCSSYCRGPFFKRSKGLVLQRRLLVARGRGRWLWKISPFRIELNLGLPARRGNRRLQAEPADDLLDCSVDPLRPVSTALTATRPVPLRSMLSRRRSASPAPTRFCS